MTNLSLNEIDNIRKSGFRPQVIGVIHNEGKILMCYKNEYKLWMFPQGGIDNHETIEQGFWREMSEELGKKFVNNCNEEIQFVLKNKSKFTKDKFGLRELFTNSGDQIHMKGKYYFAFACESKLQSINIEQTEFDDCQWFDYQSAKNIANDIYQPSKKRITHEIIEKMHELGLI